MESIPTHQRHHRKQMDLEEYTYFRGGRGKDGNGRAPTVGGGFEGLGAVLCSIDGMTGAADFWGGAL